MKSKLTHEDLATPIRRGIVPLSANYGISPITTKSMFLECVRDGLSSGNRSLYIKGLELKGEKTLENGDVYASYSVNGPVKVEGVWFLVDLAFSGEKLNEMEIRPVYYDLWEKHMSKETGGNVKEYNEAARQKLSPWLSRLFGKPDYKTDRGDCYDATNRSFTLLVATKNKKMEEQPLRLVFTYFN